MLLKKTLNNYNEEDLTFWKETTKQENIERAKLAFPYSYDPNNKTEAYLELSNSEEETKPLKR